jgi:hypothetical protein
VNAKRPSKGVTTVRVCAWLSTLRSRTWASGNSSPVAAFTTWPSTVLLTGAPPTACFPASGAPRSRTTRHNTRVLIAAPFGGVLVALANPVLERKAPV